MVKVRLPRLDNTVHFLYRVNMCIKATAIINSTIGKKRILGFCDLLQLLIAHYLEPLS